MGGGGGSSGKLDFPDHMKDTHRDWLGYSSNPDTPVDTDLIQVMNTALGTGGNPWESVALTDPSSDFTEVEDEFLEYHDEISTSSASNEWANFISLSETEVDSFVEDIPIDSIINNAINKAIFQVGNPSDPEFSGEDWISMITSLDWDSILTNLDWNTVRGSFDPKSAIDNLSTEIVSALSDYSSVDLSSSDDVDNIIGDPSDVGFVPLSTEMSASNRDGDINDYESLKTDVLTELDSINWDSTITEIESLEDDLLAELDNINWEDSMNYYRSQWSWVFADSGNEWRDIADRVISYVDDNNVLEDIDPSSIINNATSSADTVVNQAISTALTTLNSQLVEDAVSAFANRTDMQKQRSINRFSATMSDINAVNSSAYMFGLAIIEAENLQNINEFQSNLELQLYQQIIQQYTEIFTNEINYRIQTEITNKQSYEQFIGQQTQVSSGIESENDQIKSTLVNTLLGYINNKTEAVNTKRGVLNALTAVLNNKTNTINSKNQVLDMALRLVDNANEFLGIKANYLGNTINKYNADTNALNSRNDALSLMSQEITSSLQGIEQRINAINTELQLESQNLGAETEGVNIQSNFDSNLLNIESTYEANKMNSFINMISEVLGNSLRSKIVDKTSRDDKILTGASQLIQTLDINWSHRYNLPALLSEIKRTKIVGTQEYELAEGDINYKFSNWDFEVFQNASNVLGSISGAAGRLPDQPSRVGSAIGGALSGAASGAAAGSVVPGIGTTVGAGVGALLGGASGLLS